MGIYFISQKIVLNDQWGEIECVQSTIDSVNSKIYFFPSLDISSLVPAAPHDKCPLPSLGKVSNVIFRLNKFSFLSTRGFDQMLWSQTSHLLLIRVI